MTTAFSGTTTERNTIISSRNDTSSTPPKKSGSRSATPRVVSTLAATIPPTCDGQSGAVVAAGMASSRSASTRSSVAASWGEVVGDQGQHRGVAGVVEDGRGDVRHAVDLDSGVSPTASAEARRSPVPPWTVSTIGAEKPGPKPSASRS